jgi:hypothetical protein
VKKLTIAIDDYVDAAQKLCNNKSVGAAFSFWEAQRRVAKSAIANGKPSWDVIRAIVVERHGMPALAAVSEAAGLRSKYFVAPGESAPSVGGGHGGAGGRKHDQER